MKKKKENSNASGLKIIPLGGLEQIGMNITAFQYEDSIIVVDCGLSFPADDMLGIDLVIPDVTYLKDNIDKVKGFVITHGHEDHIGALPYVLRDINVPIYATRLTMGIIENKLTEHNLMKKTKRKVVKFGQSINLGDFRVEFIKTNHSIVDAAALAIYSPAGIVVHTGDFKVDYTPVYGDAIDLQRFAEIGKKGVLALMCDSTNAERPGFTPSEKTVGKTFDTLFEEHKNTRIFVATFASYVDRVQQIINTAYKFGRKVAVEGRSMVNIISIASELGYLNIPDNTLIEVDQLKKSAILAEKDRTVQPENEEEESDDDAIDPKLERILKICSGVVAVIIVLVVILLIGKVAGWWGGGSNKKPTPTSTADASADPQSSAAALGKVAVPDLVNHTLEEAEKMLDEAGLKYQLKPVESEEDANTVTDQEPKSGEEVEEGTRVTIYYSQESSGITIPDVTNKSLEDATSQLESSNLTVKGTTEKYSDIVAKGKVCGTDPVVGSSVAKGTAVPLIISKGPENDMVRVPNLVKKSLEVARERLADVGLEAPDEPTYVYSDTVQKGYVVSQSKKSGTKVEVGTVIEFTVSLGSKHKATEKPAATPTTEPKYKYTGSLTISANPFDYEDEAPASIKLVLEQDGKSKTAWSGTLSYSDFPRKFSVEGYSDNNGKITLYKDGVEVGGPYNVEFKKERQ